MTTSPSFITIDQNAVQIEIRRLVNEQVSLANSKLKARYDVELKRAKIIISGLTTVVEALSPTAKPPRTRTTFPKITAVQEDQFIGAYNQASSAKAAYAAGLAASGVTYRRMYAKLYNEGKNHFLRRFRNWQAKPAVQPAVQPDVAV